MILYSRYERIPPEFQAYDAIIGIGMSEERLAHCEAMVQIKAERVDEILPTLESLMATKA